MSSVYKRLAEILDSIPNGYPATDSGVELQILEKLFSQEEAELTCSLELEGQSPLVIAQRVGWDESKTFTMLKSLVKKGLIQAERGQGTLNFKLIPFVIGIYEYQNGKMDEEFVFLFERYYKEALHKVMDIKPAISRVIPINAVIPMNVELMPYESASDYIENAKDWGVIPCICRQQKRMIGEGCQHTSENCLVFSSRPGVFEKAKDIRALSKDEALDLLKKAGEEGLVHTVKNYQNGVDFICNCCSCSCAILRGIAEFGHLNAVGKSGYIVSVDENLCTGCSICVDRCHFKALTIVDGVCKKEESRCFGCGVCVLTCPTQALSLVSRPIETIDPLSVTEKEWQEKRVVGRHDFIRDNIK